MRLIESKEEFDSTENGSMREIALVGWRMRITYDSADYSEPSDPA